MASDKRRLLKKILIGCMLIMVFHYVTKWLTHKPPQASPYPLVVVQKPKLIQMTDYVTQTGTMVAFNSVDLVARIEGYLNAIEFTDGTFIKKGQGLFVIEPEPYLEKVKEAQASVVIAKASYAYANAEFHRQKKMYTQNATSLNNVEKWQAQAEKTKAEIDKANANEVVAQINYSYTHVLAPFDGRIGRHLVDIGNLVGNGVATDLATIEQIDPIYAYFNLNELDLIKIRSAARATAFNPENLAQVPVEVSMQGETGFPHKGSMNFVNTGLNASTGTMEFRALLTNHDYTLLPGLFVQVRIPITKPKPQLTIPDAAVQYDQIGAYVLVMDKQQMVSVKRVSVGVLEQGVRAIKTGLDAQDDVIISGIQNAVPNHQVTPVQREKKPA